MTHLLEKFSPTAIIDYLSCPKLFYYRYIAKIQLPQKKIHLEFGSAIHAAIENSFIGKDPYAAFETTFDINHLMPEERDSYEEYVKLGKEMVNNWMEAVNMIDGIYDIKKGRSEVYIKKVLKNPITGEPLPIPMSGRIDRITDGHRIIEFKTASKPWSDTDLNYKLQTNLYSLWHYTEYGEIPQEIVYIVLLKKYKNQLEQTSNLKKDQYIQILPTNLTLTDLASTFEEVKAILDKINNKEFDEPTGFHPSWCDCKKYEELLNIR